jgi:CubicO group peptidase (beta-lactamase class C family)
VEDLYRWNEGIFNGRTLDAASVKEAFTPVKTMENDGDNLWDGYGFGWIIDRDRGWREIWHNGGLNGFKGCLLRVTDNNFTVAVLANANPGRPNADPDRLARQLADIFLANKSPAPAHH